jgi:hypothetical protein
MSNIHDYQMLVFPNGKVIRFLHAFIASSVAKVQALEVFFLNIFI